MKKEFFDANQARWDAITPIHLKSEMYDVPSLLAGKNMLPKLDQELLTASKGKSCLHLQCHFGADSISISRMGAKVTGVDLSPKAIQHARELAIKCNEHIKFVCSNVLELSGKIDHQFDVIYTSYGTTIWLPDLNQWFKVIEEYLKPGGQFILVDFHPAFYTLDHASGKFNYPYFERAQPIEEIVKGSYADPGADVVSREFTWSHNIADHLRPFLQKSWKLKYFNEYDYIPYNCFENLDNFEEGKYRYKGDAGVLPHLFSFCFEKNE